MNYYRLKYSLVRDNVGHYPQASEVEYHCPQWYPAGTIHPTLNSASGIEPVTRVILHPHARPTDLISMLPGDANERLLVSSNLKTILELYTNGGIKFIPAEVIAGSQSYDNYWLMTVYELNMEFVDFVGSEVILRKSAPDNKITISRVEIAGLQRFLHLAFVEKPEGDLILNKVRVKPSVSRNFFKIHHTESHHDFLVSENLKNTITSNCSGIEFQPADYSVKQWLAMSFSAALEP